MLFTSLEDGLNPRSPIFFQVGGSNFLWGRVCNNIYLAEQIIQIAGNRCKKILFS
jgi:hypothetical protein